MFSNIIKCENLTIDVPNDRNRQSKVFYRCRRLLQGGRLGVTAPMHIVGTIYYTLIKIENLW